MTRGTRLFSWIYIFYAISVVGATLFLVSVRGLEQLTSAEDHFLLPGAVAFFILVPGGVHSNAPLEALIAFFNILVYLASPLLALAIFKWWKRINRPWTPKD